MSNGSLPCMADVLVVVEALAILAFAVSGLLEAARKGLDAVEICMVTGLAAFGGGTMRDIPLDRRPLFWVEHAGWLWVLMLSGIVAMFFMRARHLLQAPEWIGLLGPAVVATGLRALALATGLTLPKWPREGLPHR